MEFGLYRIMFAYFQLLKARRLLQPVFLPLVNVRRSLCLPKY